MYYKSGIGGYWQCSIGAGHMRLVHSPAGSSFLREMTPWAPSWNYL